MPQQAGAKIDRNFIREAYFQESTTYTRGVAVIWDTSTQSYVKLPTASGQAPAGIGPPAGGSPGALYANLVDTTGTDHILSTPIGVVDSNQWQHVALTYDALTGEAVLYYNGIPVAQDIPGTFQPQTSTSLFIGKRPVGPSGSALFEGFMDELSLYSAALSSADIQAIFDQGTAGKSAPEPVKFSIRPFGAVMSAFSKPVTGSENVTVTGIG